jgi:hypothetical protein
MLACLDSGTQVPWSSASLDVGLVPGAGDMTVYVQGVRKEQTSMTLADLFKISVEGGVGGTASRSVRKPSQSCPGSRQVPSG